MKKVSRVNDLSYRKAFGSQNRTAPLTGFAKDIFGIDIKDIQFETPYSIDDYKEYLEGKEITTLRQTIRDIGAIVKIDDKDRLLTCELQLKHNNYFTERSLYYPFKRYCDNYNLHGKMVIDKDGKPNRYSSLIPIYEIVTLGFNSFSDKNNLRVTGLHDPIRNIGLGKELIKIAYFEFKKPNVEGKVFDYWRDYFMDNDISDEAPDYIKEAAEITDYANMSKEEQKLIDQLEKATADYEAEMSTAWFDGKDEGEKNKTMEVFRNLLNLDAAEDFIIKALSLSPDEFLEYKYQVKLDDAKNDNPSEG